jgi:NAD(P)-dependent dehydrogenase (short-subunit alcohol dehydrogenase family)
MKTIILTGATGAIGSATASALAAKGSHLVLVGRNKTALENLTGSLVKYGGKVETVLCDLSDTASVKRAVLQIKTSHPVIHGVVNIAALYKSSLDRTPQKLETMFAVNHLGPFMLTTGLLNGLRAAEGSKVLTVSAPSSTKIDFDNLNAEKKFSAFNAFGGSKMMNLLFSFNLARKFNGTGHASMAFHPGLVKSSLLKEAPSFVKGFLKLVSSDPQVTGEAIATLMLNGDPAAQNGKFYNKSLKELKAAPHAYDENIQQRLWEKSLDLAG